VEQVEYLLEVTAMQQIFYTPVPPEEYARLGKDFPFPQPTSCPNPGCLVKAPPQKHGIVSRKLQLLAIHGAQRPVIFFHPQIFGGTKCHVSLRLEK
jgi:hypothetical protein